MKRQTAKKYPDNFSAPTSAPRAYQLIGLAFRHWLLLANLFLGLYVGLAVLSPVLLAVGWPLAGRLLFAVYGLVCHQLPGRSFYILGHQIALCQRDLAIYGAMLVVGMVYALRRSKVSALSWRLWLLALLPMALDGGTQLVGSRESAWEWRLLTGGLFGVATVWLLYPTIDQLMESEWR